MKTTQSKLRQEIEFQPDDTPDGAPYDTEPDTHLPTKQRRLRKTIVLSFGLFLGLAILAGIGIAVLLRVAPPQHNTFGFEVAKSLLQFLTVGFLGTLASLIVGEYNRQRARKDTENEFRKGMYRTLIKTYQDTKKVRRSLRACQTMNASGQPIIPFNSYREYMLILMDSQLAFEAAVREVEMFPSAFDQPQTLINELKRMEKYLREILKEYESLQRSRPGKSDPVEIDDGLLYLSDFLGSLTSRARTLKYDASDFYDAASRAMEILQQERLRP